VHTLDVGARVVHALAACANAGRTQLARAQQKQHRQHQQHQQHTADNVHLQAQPEKARNRQVASLCYIYAYTMGK
jgi:hypothetical protein